MKKLSHLLILLPMVFVAIACNDDSPQQEDIKENKTYVPNSGLRYKRISGNVYDIPSSPMMSSRLPTFSINMRPSPILIHYSSMRLASIICGLSLS